MAVATDARRRHRWIRGQANSLSATVLHWLQTNQGQAAFSKGDLLTLAMHAKWRISSWDTQQIEKLVKGTCFTESDISDKEQSIFNDCADRVWDLSSQERSPAYQQRVLAHAFFCAETLSLIVQEGDWGQNRDKQGEIEKSKSWVDGVLHLYRERQNQLDLR
jgi:hypothetical protein